MLAFFFFSQPTTGVKNRIHKSKLRTKLKLLIKKGRFSLQRSKSTRVEDSKQSSVPSKPHDSRVSSWTPHSEVPWRLTNNNN